MTDPRIIACALVLALAAGCGADAPGTGTAKFTTWGEEYIEIEIPSDPTGEDGFVDGWKIQFSKFLVAFHEITVSGGGKVAARMAGSKLVDNHVAGRKDLVTFAGLEARHWEEVGYQIKPATAASELVGATAADRDLMVAGGFSVYVAGAATKDAGGAPTTKTFAWGFGAATQYSRCEQPAESGDPIEGLVVTAGGTAINELTTHGDHFFYDRLMESPDPAKKTSLRFDALAAADTNADGEITLAELDAVTLDVLTYDPSGFEVTTLGGFVRALVRTVGHYHGEGECRVSAAP